MLANIYDDSADDLNALEMTLKLPADAPDMLANIYDDSADELKASEKTLKCWRTHPFRWRRHTMTLRTSCKH